MSSYPPASTSINATNVNKNNPNLLGWISGSANQYSIFVAAIFLVLVPVFLQAPLVRSYPWVSLAATSVWLGLGFTFCQSEKNAAWGDLLIGFALTWLAGSIYWGWLRWEPLLHLPVEALGLPAALWSFSRRSGLIGSLFYLGSLLGTAATDLYFYIVNLIPHWRQLMQIDRALALPTLQDALLRIQTSWGISWVIALAGVLLIVGILPLRSHKLHWWSFSGAVLSTILVDSLFWLAASSA